MTVSRPRAVRERLVRRRRVAARDRRAVEREARYWVTRTTTVKQALKGAETHAPRWLLVAVLARIREISGMAPEARG